MATVVLGMSGGVGSTYAGLKLIRDGYDVHGVYLRYDNGVDDYRLARDAAVALGVPLEVVDVTPQMEMLVRGPFYAARRRSVLQWPCDRCASLVRFPALLRVADRIGAEKIATGHFARIRGGRLYRSFGPEDQSMMLWRLTPDVIDRCLFPSGGQWNTPALRRALWGYIHQAMPPSMDLCFQHDRMHSDHLIKHDAVGRPGPLILAEGPITGYIGRHSGSGFFIPGVKRFVYSEGCSGVWFFCKKVDPDTSTVYLTDRTPHYSGARLQFISYAAASYVGWPQFRCLVRLWESQPPRRATVYADERLVLFDEEIRLGPGEDIGDVLPGGIMVFYGEDGLLIGGAVIESTLPADW